MTSAEIRAYLAAFEASATRSELEAMHVHAFRLKERRPGRDIRAGLRELMANAPNNDSTETR